MAVGELKGLQSGRLVQDARFRVGITARYLHTIGVMATVEERLPLEVRYEVLYCMRHILALGIAAAHAIVEVLLVPGLGLDLLVGRFAELDGILVGAACVVEPADDPLHRISDHVYIDRLRQVELAKVQPIDVPYVNGALVQASHQLGSFSLHSLWHLPHCAHMQAAALQFQVIVILDQCRKQLEHCLAAHLSGTIEEQNIDFGKSCVVQALGTQMLQLQNTFVSALSSYNPQLVAK